MLKKFLALILCLTLIVSSVALAEMMNFGTMTDDDLVLLLNQLEAEIAARGIDTSALIYAGTYVVGKDIKAGQYILTVADSEYGMDIITFETEDTYASYFETKRFTVGEEREAIEANASSKAYARKLDTVSLNLHDGMVLLLKDGTGRLEAMKPSWAP